MVLLFYELIQYGIWIIFGLYFYSFMVKLLYRMERSGTDVDFLEDLSPLSQALIQSINLPLPMPRYHRVVSLLSLRLFVSNLSRQDF